jgi:hypothetical protein
MEVEIVAGLRHKMTDECLCFGVICFCRFFVDTRTPAITDNLDSYVSGIPVLHSDLSSRSQSLRL